MAAAEAPRADRAVGRGPGFAVLYRWQLRPGLEDSFVDAWSRLSKALLHSRGSLGSRLHRGADGLWYSYAQWPSAEARRQAFAAEPVDAAADEQMQAAVAKAFPELVLASVADFLVLPGVDGSALDRPDGSEPVDAHGNRVGDGPAANRDRGDAKSLGVDSRSAGGGATSPHGLLLFAHGARDARWALPFDAVAARVRARAAATPVVLAFLEFMQPGLVDAGRQLAAAGCSRVDVVPLFLGAGGHVRKDLPALLHELRVQHPSVDWRLRPAIGEVDAVVDAMADAALAALPAG